MVVRLLKIPTEGGVTTGDRCRAVLRLAGPVFSTTTLQVGWRLGIARPDSMVHALSLTPKSLPRVVCTLSSRPVSIFDQMRLRDLTTDTILRAPAAHS